MELPSLIELGKFMGGLVGSILIMWMLAWFFDRIDQNLK